MYKQIILKPRMSEKAYSLSQNGVYVITVPNQINKHDIIRAVKAQFDVTVESVRIANIQGKAKRTIAQKGRVVRKGSNSDIKKAYITLKQGESLPFFKAMEEAEEKQQATQEKVAKAVEKQIAKEAKKSSGHGIHLPGRHRGARGGDK